jgi:altronate dehydratase
MVAGGANVVVFATARGWELFLVAKPTPSGKAPAGKVASNVFLCSNA